MLAWPLLRIRQEIGYPPRVLNKRSDSLDKDSRLCHSNPAELLIQRLNSRPNTLRPFLDVNAQRRHRRGVAQLRLDVLGRTDLLEPCRAGPAEDAKLTEVAGSTHCLPFGQSSGFFCMIPARTAAGQMWRRRKFLVLIGRPLAAGKINVDELVARQFRSSSVIDFGSQTHARDPGVLVSLICESTAASSMRKRPPSASKSSHLVANTSPGRRPRTMQLRATSRSRPPARRGLLVFARPDAMAVHHAGALVFSGIQRARRSQLPR
jgi:hypothetical protein